MKRQYIRVFQKDPKKLQEMLCLRARGWSLPDLGRRFDVDHSSILYHCKKHDVEPPEKLLKIDDKDIEIEEKEKELLGGELTKKIKKYKNQDLIIEGEGKINEGKSYKEYRAESERRKKLLLVK